MDGNPTHRRGFAWMETLPQLWRLWGEKPYLGHCETLPGSSSKPYLAGSFRRSYLL